MAISPSLLHSSASSFLPQFRPSPLQPSSSSSSLFIHRNKHGSAVVSVKATAAGAVLVEKSEAEQVLRLKTTYNDKIIPLLMEEFSYTNIHQVSSISLSLLRNGNFLKFSDFEFYLCLIVKVQIFLFCFVLMGLCSFGTVWWGNCYVGMNAYFVYRVGLWSAQTWYIHDNLRKLK